MAVIQKVTDPNKIVTDAVLLSVLAKQGIDSDYVEFFQDYAPRTQGKERSPYAKFYRDLQSGKRLMVVSALPMVDAYGSQHELVWSDKNGIIENGNNIFHCIVDKGAIRLVVLSDQPAGARKGDEVSYFPQLFIGNTEVQPTSLMPSRLETDPINGNYHDNVLEWDYGICRRRLRIAEGRFRERWVFASNPNRDIRIKHNFSGVLKVKLGYGVDVRGKSLKVLVVGDEEVVAAADLKDAVFPIEIGASATFYPDAHAETSSVDGDVRQEYSPGAGQPWATLVGAAGYSARDSQTTFNLCFFYADTVSNKWLLLDRGIALFDTSSLPDDAIISAATLSFYGQSKADALSAAPNINIYSSAPAANTALAADDYDSLGATAFCDTAITYSGFSTGGYNDFVLNASGITAILKTGVSKFGIRNAKHDVANSAPPWSSENYSYLAAYAAEQGTGYKPKLVVIYEATAKSSSDAGAGVESLDSRLFGIAETGSGIEAIISRWLGAAETGLGTEVGGLLKNVFGGDGGSGFDALKAVIQKAGSSSDMRLFGRPGQVKIPSKGVNL